MSQLTTQIVTLEFTLEKPVEELADKIADRGWRIEGVTKCDAIGAIVVPGAAVVPTPVKQVLEVKVNVDKEILAAIPSERSLSWICADYMMTDMLTGANCG